MNAFSTPTETTAPDSHSQARQDVERVMQTAIEHHRKEEYDQAAALYTSVLNALSDHVDANYHLGVLRMQTGQPAEAVAHFEAVLGHTPKNGQIWVYYINALVASQQPEAARLALDLAQQQGLPASAVQTLHARINGEEEATPPATPEPEAAPAPQSAASGEDVAAPEGAETDERVKLDTRRASAKEMRQYQHLFTTGKLEAALKVARRLTEQYPSHGECWIELGRVLQATSHYKEAVEAAEHAARLLPNSLAAQTVLADRLVVSRQHRRAEEHCRKALEKYPDSAVLHRDLGSALADLGRTDEGFVHLRRAVELAPNNAVELDALGTALGRHGLFDEAEAAFRRALELAPMQYSTHSNLLFYVMHKPDIDAASAFAEFRQFAARHEVALRERRPRHANDRDPSRRLRIGFVSGDLLNHPVAYFFLSVLEQLAGDTSLSLHIYSNYMVTDAFTAQIRAHAQSWTEVYGMSNELMAQKIRDDGIDILIDLSGHTGRNRLMTFTHKPAPVQASWIGNPATTGLDSVDYYLSDRYVTPLEQFESRFSEKLVFLPALAPFKPHPKAPDVNELPALKNGFITFGSFSRIVKIGPEVMALWARVLREVPNSRMLIGAISAQDQMVKMIEMFASEGIDANRISFLKRGSVTNYLQQHHLIDVCLDTFPFGNSTTTMQALWMGVPTMTLPGDSMASRSSTGWLSHLGLDTAFVAQDKDDFVRKCAALAADPEALAAVRRELREHCRQSVLIDAGAIANAASRAFRIMWQRWCDGLKPEHFEVQAQTDGAPGAGEPPPSLPRDPHHALTGEFVETLTVLFNKQQFAEAEAIARQFTALFPEAVTSWQMLARSLREQSKPLEAIEPLRRANALQPDNINLRHELGMLSQYANDLKRIAPVNEAMPAAGFAAVRPGSRQFRHPVGALVANMPVLIPTFNNATYLRRMVSQLQARGLRNIIVVDNASSAPGMLDYLDSIQDTVSVVRLDHNVGPRAITLSDVIYHRLPELFCVTDPDLELNPELPDTFLFDLIEATETLRIGKAGFALDISQPELMNEKSLAITQSDGVKSYNLIEWEGRFWRNQLGSTAGGDPIYKAAIDTTFAVYNKRYFRPDTHLAGVRFGGRYTCKHLPWYKDNGLDAAEDQYYRKHQEWSTFMSRERT